MLFSLDYSRVEVAADTEKQKIVNGKWEEKKKIEAGKWSF